MQIDFVGRSNNTETVHPFGKLVILCSEQKGLTSQREIANKM